MRISDPFSKTHSEPVDGLIDAVTASVLFFEVLIVVGIMFMFTGTEDASLLGGILGFVFNGAGIALGFCSIVRKFHDFDWGGVSIFLLFIPIVNIVIALMLLFRSGTRGNNKHGDELLDVEVGF